MPALLGLPLTAVALVAILSSAALVPAGPQRGKGAVPLTDARTLAEGSGSARAVAAITSGRVVQALPDSGLVALTYGIRSAAVASDPAYAVLSPSLTRAQCDVELPRLTRWLLVRDDLAETLRRDPVCRSRFATTQAIRFAGVQLLPLSRR